MSVSAAGQQGRDVVNRGRASSVPPAYQCTMLRASSSSEVMADPVLARCAHLFDRAVLKAEGNRCPIDQSLFSARSCLPFAELKAKIEEYKKAKQVAQQSRSSVGSEGGGGAAKGPGPIKLRVIKDAHPDDVHGIIALSPNIFVSGSKDASLKVWDANKGALIKSMKPNGLKGYQYWVTALTRFSNGDWASGSRDGCVTLWGPKGQERRTLRYNPQSRDHKCKDRNKVRINCITEDQSDAQGVTRFYTGTPKYVQLWDARQGRLVKSYKASDNDWVYCVKVIENRRLLVVIGADLENWNMSSGEPDKTTIMKESAADRVGKQRPHISAITRLDHDPNLLAAALFGGKVKVVDIASSALVCEYHEHKKRVWSVMNFTDQTFASSSDDRTIKIWDVRQRRSVFTIKGAPGRVSSLKRLSPNTFVSASCPDDLRRSKEKASITFWDIRKITERIQAGSSEYE